MDLRSGGSCSKGDQGPQQSPSEPTRGEPRGTEDNKDPLVMEVAAEEDTVTKTPRRQGSQPPQGQGGYTSKDQDMKKKRRKNNRRKKKELKSQTDALSAAVVVPQKTLETREEMEEMETQTNQAQTTVETQTKGQQEDHQAETCPPQLQQDGPGQQRPDTTQAPLVKDAARKVQAQTQTRKSKGRNKVTQTPRVSQTTQGTQTDPVVFTQPTKGDRTEMIQPTKDDPSQPMNEQSSAEAANEGTASGSSKPMKVDPPDTTQPTQDDPSQPMKEQNSTGTANEGAASEPSNGGNPDCSKGEKGTSETEVKPSGKGQGNPTDSQVSEGGEPMSYAKAAAGQERGPKDQGSKVSQGKGSRDRSPVRGPPGVPMFTIHIYAVLDKKFKFNQEHDKLLLCCGAQFEFEITHFV